MSIAAAPRPGKFTVESPAPRDEWTELLDADPDAVLEQGPLWVDALASAGRWKDASRLYRLGDGRNFVLPLVTRSSHSLAPQSGFAPSWGIGGIVGPHLSADVATLIDADLAESGALWVHLRPNPTQAAAWTHGASTSPKSLPRRAHVLELERDTEQVFARFRQSARRHVRKADKHGVEFTTTTGGVGLPAYYDELFLPSVDRWATKQHEPVALARFRAKRRDPLSKLQRIAAVLGDSFRLTLAYVDGEVAAGNIVLVRPNAHYTRGAMNERAARTGAAYGAMWHTIRTCCDEGVRWFHMGETGSSDSLASYKEGFGAKSVDYHEYRYERLPLLALDQRSRALVKKVIRFSDT